MDRALELDITEHVMKLVEANTSDLAPSTYEVPVESYTSAERARSERRELFLSKPQMVGLSCEVPAPRDWKTIEVAGRPLLIMRDADGKVGTFLNVCRHRGMQVAEGRGHSARLTCPYHAWSYDNRGALAAVPSQTDGFTDMCLADRGLVPVPTVERDGLIWAVPDPGRGAPDLDEHLGDIGQEFASWNPSDWQYVESRIHHTAVNWKIALESYVENYHVKVLHKNTIAAYAKSYGGYHLTFGDHQRIAFPNEPIHALEGIPKDQWQSFDSGALAVVYHFFPGTLFVMFFNHIQVFQISPGETADTSTTIQSLFLTKPATPEELQALQTQFKFVYDVVAQEDYVVGARIQAHLNAGANESLIFGRQEIALQHLHEACIRNIG